MSQSPNSNQPPKGAPQESLQDVVYRSSLAEGNSAIRRVNPLVSVPITLLTWGGFAVMLYYGLTQTGAGKKLVKNTIGIDLQEQEDEAPPPPPPPPPPAPAAPVVAPKVVEQKDAPPPPPINPNQDIVPEIAPKELPKTDLSTAYAVAAGSQGAGGGPSVAGAGTGAGMAVGGATAKVVDFDFSQVKIKLQPPAPPYPAIARMAKVQGTVVVEIIIGVDGVPTSAVAIDGPSQLRSSAENYARSWRFEPALLNGVPQVARFRLTMPYRLK